MTKVILKRISLRIVIQRVSEAKVEVEEQLIGSIGKGLLLLLGVEEADSEEDVDWLCKKVIGMRIFSDEEGKMNLDVKDVQGEILVVSQFTLHASTKKGNRPSFIKSAHPQKAEELYESFKKKLGVHLGKDVASGAFGANMQVSLVNDGPVTILIDSKNRE